MRIGVYGLGRFGAFWAKELSGLHEVVGYSRNVGREVPAGVERVDEETLLGSDVIVLCVAISAMENVLERIGGRLQPGSLVMDTCSVKVYPSELMLKYIPEPIDVLGTHPMVGPDSGAEGVEGLPLVFCPLRIGEERAGLWRGVFGSLGLNVVDMSPDEHDRQAALTQGITHFMGRVLGEMGLEETPIATLGYGKLLEIVEQTCNDPWQLFLDLQRYNPYTGGMHARLNEVVLDMLGKIDSV